MFQRHRAFVEELWDINGLAMAAAKGRTPPCAVAPYANWGQKGLLIAFYEFKQGVAPNLGFSADIVRAWAKPAVSLVWDCQISLFLG